MIFLIEYDRASAALLRFTPFADEHRGAAESARLALELELLRSGQTHEVVLLEAVDEAAVRRTHQRYFETLESIISSMRRSLSEDAAAHF